MNLNDKIDELLEIREQIQALKRCEKELQEKYDSRVQNFILSLDELGLQSIKGTNARITITENEVPKLIDWDQFTAFILLYDAFHLLQKRPAANAVREFAQITGSLPPGIETVKLRDLSIRTL